MDGSYNGLPSTQLRMNAKGSNIEVTEAFAGPHFITNRSDKDNHTISIIDKYYLTFDSGGYRRG